MIDQNEPTTNDLEPSSPSIDSGLPAIKKYKANPNRKKREASINPEYEAAIIKILFMYGRIGFNTKSAIIEHMFLNKSFTRNECDIKISEINSRLSGYKTQTANLLDYYIESATEDKREPAIRELKEFTTKYKLTSKEKVRLFFYQQLKSITTKIDAILKLENTLIEDDSPEIESIRNLFKHGDIKANLPSRRNIAYRLDIEVDERYFSGLKGNQNSGENRRVLEQVLINNTHFMLETSNSKHVKYIQDFIKVFNDDLKLLNIDRLKEIYTGIDELYIKLVTYNKILDSYYKEVLK